MSDEYDHMDHETLIQHIRLRGKPNWADFSDQEIRELCRLDDQDRAEDFDPS